jgi:hypothetical protein
MSIGTYVRTSTRWCSIGAATIAAAYAAYAGVTWLRYGQAADATPDEQDQRLDQFMPVYDVVERHHIRVHAPAEMTFAAASELDLMDSRIVRAVFKGRELLLGSEPDTVRRPRGLLAFAKSIGWETLTEIPDRQIIMGTVTQPWEANVVFRPLPPAEFEAFDDPGFVKIAWTLRADAVTATESVFRTETRAVATDATARRKFRRYWALLSPGIIVIRWATLEPVKAEAERRAHRSVLLTAGTGAEKALP